MVRQYHLNSYVAELKDRNRGMILLLIEKIKNSGNPEFISLLKTWQSIEYKKVRIELQKAINNLILEDDSLNKLMKPASGGDHEPAAGKDQA